MADLLRDVRSADFTADAPAVLLFLHGFGSDEHDLPGLAPHLGLGLPWASLRAPIAEGPGASWFDIVVRGDPPVGLVEPSTEAVWAWVGANLSPQSRVVPIGFSQGGLMASQLLRTRPDRVVAPAILSGFVVGYPQPADAELAASRPAVFYGRGGQDANIPEFAVQRTLAFLDAHASAELYYEPRQTHSITAEELTRLRAFLARELPAA